MPCRPSRFTTIFSVAVLFRPRFMAASRDRSWQTDEQRLELPGDSQQATAIGDAHAVRVDGDAAALLQLAQGVADDFRVEVEVVANVPTRHRQTYSARLVRTLRFFHHGDE